MNTLKTDRTRQLHDLRTRMDENFSAESINRQVFEDELRSTLTSILASDDSRRGAFQLSYEEEQQNIIVCNPVPFSVFFFFFGKKRRKFYKLKKKITEKYNQVKRFQRTENQSLTKSL